MNIDGQTNNPNEVGAVKPLPRASGSSVPYFLSLAVLLAMAYGGWKWWQVSQFDLARGEAVAAKAIGPPLKDFELMERSGQTLRSSDMRGRVWVAAYFFTSCNGSCRRLNASIQAMNNLPDLKDVTWISITCDPDNDTLEVLRAYADAYHADPQRWLFCRADLEYAKRVALGMKVYLSYKDHMDRVVVIDKAGKIRGYFDATSSIECDRMHALLLKCLAEKAPPDLAASGAANGKLS